MSLSASGESRIQEIINTARGPIKCRIPQRLPTTGRHRTLPATKPRGLKQSEPVQSRPKSANGTKDDTQSKQTVATARSEREQSTLKRLSTIPKRVVHDNMNIPTKPGRPIIMVPMIQKQHPRSLLSTKNVCGLPDQETIEKCEDLEIRQDESNAEQKINESNEGESITSRSDKVMQLKISWQDKMVQFEKMKNELNDRQRAIMELYATMRNTHQKMSTFGQKTSLPPPEELRIMNVAKMTPDQLLQLCAGSRIKDDKLQRDCSKPLPKTPLTVDLNKLYNLPTNLVATCEQTLIKRKEIIDWFKSLTSQEKGISLNKLTKKINEFNGENEMLNCTLENVKEDFLVELNEIVDFLRKGVNETMILQLRTEELTNELSELNSHNTDLRKQIQNADHLKCVTNRNRLEELEKELKEEKSKKIIIRDRLSRAEGQIKIGNERAVQLEAALEQSRTQSWSLERTVQQLHEQNQKLQADFDKELNKLTDSIRENTVHLEDIADAREKLQMEKEDLEKRLEELSGHYNESLNNMKHEMNANMAKLIETEKKYNESIESKKQLEEKVESLCAQLLESELRCKDILKKLQENECQLNKNINSQKDLETVSHELHIANMEIDDYKNRLLMQNEAIKEIEKKIKETLTFEENLKRDLSTKEEYISELENKQSLLEQQLRENEHKMESYEEQLSTLKIHIAQMQEDFGEFESLSEIHEMLSQQRTKMHKAIRQSDELTEALQKKSKELKQHMEALAEQRHLMEQRDNVIKILSEKDEEQTNIIKLLRNNLEMRTQADTDFNQQLAEKNAEIDSLITNLETRKQQISQLEKIILTLEDQTHKNSVQIRKDQEIISSLEKKIYEYETFHMETKHGIETPTDNLDNLIKILEDELGTPFEPRINGKDQNYKTLKKKYVGQRSKNSKLEKFEYHKNSNDTSLYKSEHEAKPTKIVLGNFVKKTYISANEEQFTGDNLGRKKAIINIDTQKSMPKPDTEINLRTDTANIKEDNISFKGIVPAAGHTKDYLVRNLPFLIPNQLREEKKSKMFKLAGHKL